MWSITALSPAIGPLLSAINSLYLVVTRHPIVVAYQLCHVVLGHCIVVSTSTLSHRQSFIISVSLLSSCYFQWLQSQGCFQVCRWTVEPLYMAFGRGSCHPFLCCTYTLRRCNNIGFCGCTDPMVEVCMTQSLDRHLLPREMVATRGATCMLVPELISHFGQNTYPHISPYWN